MSAETDRTDSEHGIDVQRMVEQVRAGLRAKGAGGNSRAESDSAVHELRRAARTFDEDLYRCLQKAKATTAAPPVDHKVGYRTPIIGQAWAVVRRRIHQEVRIYIDALTQQQASFNNLITRTISSLVWALDEMDIKSLAARQAAQQQTIEELQEEIALLREQVRSLESSTGRPGSVESRL